VDVPGDGNCAFYAFGINALQELGGVNPVLMPAAAHPMVVQPLSAFLTAMASAIESNAFNIPGLTDAAAWAPVKAAVLALRAVLSRFGENLVDTYHSSKMAYPDPNPAIEVSAQDRGFYIQVSKLHSNGRTTVWMCYIIYIWGDLILVLHRGTQQYTCTGVCM
jgi:hypothetical protein